MELTDALDLARSHRNGVLVTLKRDGRPQLSNIIHTVSDDGVIRISVTGDRAKAINMRRDPRVSLYINREDHWAYVVLEGVADLTPEATAPDDTTVEGLVDFYRAIQGEHEDWDDYRATMIRDRRLLVTIRPDHAYGMWS